MSEVPKPCSVLNFQCTYSNDYPGAGLRDLATYRDLGTNVGDADTK